MGVDTPFQGQRPALRAGRIALLAMLAIAAGAVVTQASAETLIIQGSTTFYRRIVEPTKGMLENESRH
jgi:hypothetical protein